MCHVPFFLPYCLPHVPSAVFSFGGISFLNVVWWGLGGLRGVVDLVGLVPCALT